MKIVVSLTGGHNPNKLLKRSVKQPRAIHAVNIQNKKGYNNTEHKSSGQSNEK